MPYFYITNNVYKAARVLAGRTMFLAVKCKGVDFHRSVLRDVFGTNEGHSIRSMKRYIKGVLEKDKKS